MIKLINRVELLNKDENEQYYNILKAQLSTYELVFIYYYNSIIGDSSKIIEQCITEYNLFESLDESILLHNDPIINESKLEKGNNA